MLICFSCNRFYNLQERKPIALPCTDFICLQCYQQQKDQVQNEKIYCPFEDNHQFAKDSLVLPSQFLMRQLQQYDFYNIKCDDHPNKNAHVYCKDLNKMICSRCLSIDPHSHYITDKTRHFELQRPYLEESFTKMIPILKEEIIKIEQMLESYQQFITKDRDFTVAQIQNLIKLNMEILQHSNIDENLRKNLRDKFEILDFIIPFSDKYRQKFNIVNDYEEERKENYVGEIQIPQHILQHKDMFIEFRRLVDLELQQGVGSIVSKNISRDLKISYKLLYSNSLPENQTIDQFRYSVYYRGANVCFILSNHGLIFGGYTKCSWETSSYQGRMDRNDDNAFLFSLSKNKVFRQIQNFHQSISYGADKYLRFGQLGLSIENNCFGSECNSAQLGSIYQTIDGYQIGDEISKKFLSGGEKFKVIYMEVYKVNFC
ncbi:tldc domain-containing protein [Stylonychia lemnae]|uniref:Tldc domain-containing protein n=1 Tax=Stylonychia lemnae TaxID=5949 RepID=A0A078B086_STYLE|nr:tldc domain-containing protein [Stylonychia lemnae]|eukprot:CDW86498.1 tldc domain-containing protein [Stylonychia lemnae]